MSQGFETSIPAASGATEDWLSCLATHKDNMVASGVVFALQSKDVEDQSHASGRDQW